MRRITRNFLLGLLALIVLLLALGALPGLLKAGDPYYLTATPTPGGETADAGQPDEGPDAVNATDLPESRYPYATAALSDATADAPGRSDSYWRGPIGIKGAFTHSPFDEVDALAGRNRNATDGDGVLVRHEGTVYRLAVTQEGSA